MFFYALKKILRNVVAIPPCMFGPISKHNVIVDISIHYSVIMITIATMRQLTQRFILQTCRKVRRKYFGVIFLCGLAFYCTHLYGYGREARFYYVFNEGCKIPFMEITDQELEKLSYDPNFFITTCPNFTLLRSNHSHIWINIDQESNVAQESVFCCHQTFERLNTVEDVFAPEKDRKVQYEPCKNFSDYIKVSSEFVKVSCSYKFLNGSYQNYVQYFVFTPVKDIPKNQDDQKSLSKLNPEYNVIILGFSGMSRMNFYRTMASTFNFLYSKGSVEMQAYHKVGDNKFVNMMPMLLGLKETEMRQTCWPHLEAHYDNCPFIWTLYQNASYFTALGDDNIHLGLFNFKRHGFIRTPTDYYLYPFMREVIGQIDQEGKSPECMGNRFVFQVLLDYIGNLTSTLRHSKLFGFFWESCMSDYVHTIPTLMDEGYFNLLKNMEHSGYLNNTILIVTAHSGMRWGRNRFTKRGRLEERLPVMQILAPMSFRKKYRQAYENLIENMYKLTSPFDVYETLKDLVNPKNIKDKNIKLRSQDSYGRNRGISLFLPIPSNRTCADLSIETHQCVCERIGKVINTNSTLALSAAKYVVEYINNLMQDYDYCATLQLRNVLQVTKFVSRTAEDFVIVAVFEPESLQKTRLTNLIEFEAKLQFNGSWNLVGKIQRTNALGYESRCLPPDDKLGDKYFQLYCYCDF